MVWISVVFSFLFFCFVFILFNNLFIFVSDKWCVEYHLWIMTCFINVHCDVYLYTYCTKDYVVKIYLHSEKYFVGSCKNNINQIDWITFNWYIREYMIHKLYNAQENQFSKQIFGIIQNWYIWLSLNIQQNRFKVISTTSRRKID